MADSRNEAILQNILGEHNELLPPVSRIEELLLQILEQGGGGSAENGSIKNPFYSQVPFSVRLTKLNGELIEGE